MSVRAILSGLVFFALGVVPAGAAPEEPDEVKQPGTQPEQVNAFDSNCDNCHASTKTDAELRHLPVLRQHCSAGFPH